MSAGLESAEPGAVSLQMASPYALIWPPPPPCWWILGVLSSSLRLSTRLRFHHYDPIEPSFPLEDFFEFTFIYFVCICTCVGAQVPPWTCGGQSVAWGSQYSTMWITGNWPWVESLVIQPSDFPFTTSVLALSQNTRWLWRHQHLNFREHTMQSVIHWNCVC